MLGQHLLWHRLSRHLLAVEEGQHLLKRGPEVPWNLNVDLGEAEPGADLLAKEPLRKAWGSFFWIGFIVMDIPLSARQFLGQTGGALTGVHVGVLVGAYLGHSTSW